MSSTETGIRALKGLAKHAELLVVAYESGSRLIPETQESEGAIRELLQLRLVDRQADDGAIRLNTVVTALLDHSLKTQRLKMFSADIGEALEGLEFLAQRYVQAKSSGVSGDSSKLLDELGGNVFELCDGLLSQAQSIWRQVEGDFGAVSQLETKMALNRNTLAKVNRILQSLELIDMEALYRISSRDRDLRKLLQVQLPEVIEQCRQILGDAIGRLNKMMFRLEQLATQATRVNQLVDYCNLHPGWQPQDYSGQLDVPALFAAVKPIRPTANAHIRDESMELVFTEILEGLRKELPPDEDQRVEPISTDIKEQAQVTLDWGGFKQAVRQVFFRCLEEDREVSGLECYTSAPDGVDVELWLYALMAEYNAMKEEDRVLFILDFPGEFDSVFDGNFHAEDVLLCPA